MYWTFSEGHACEVARIVVFVISINGVSKQDSI